MGIGRNGDVDKNNDVDDDDDSNGGDDDDCNDNIHMYGDNDNDNKYKVLGCIAATRTLCSENLLLLLQLWRTTQHRWEGGGGSYKLYQPMCGWLGLGVGFVRLHKYTRHKGAMSFVSAISRFYIFARVPFLVVLRSKIG